MNPFTDLLDIHDEESYIALLKMFDMSEAEAEDAFAVLKAVYEKYQNTFDHLYRIRHERPNPYKIVETSIGPRISDSRSMVYDVLKSANEGATRSEIALNHNLKLDQVDVALQYIEAHREVLEAELVEINARMAKEEAKYRALQKEREAELPSLAMLKERQAAYNLQEKNAVKK